ncbi:MAG: DsrE family protein [Pirellulaceae bacterium]|nr:DsrE family protein [Pirellulaceae bacterium]
MRGSCFAWVSVVFGLLAFAVTAGSNQEENPFEPGTVLRDFGEIAAVDADMTIPKGTQFQIRFDVGVQANPGKLNRTFESAARFINMHVGAGVPREAIRLAIVVHGGAVLDLTTQEHFGSIYSGRQNPSADAVKQLQECDVQFIVCGQSTAWQSISKNELLPGVRVALSAMTAHELLAQQGYTLNPF